MRLCFLAVGALVFAISPSSAFPQSRQTQPDEVSTSAHSRVHDSRRLGDLDAIGIRNVGCDRGFSNWYSLERQVEMGQAYAHRVEAGAKLITDPVVTEYINRIGQNLVRSSDAHVAFTIKVIDSDEVNAMALPGGFFYIDSGLIQATDTEAELAGIMAHEIAHVAACHAARGRTRGQLFGLATLSLTMVGGPVAFAAYEGLTASRPFALLKFSRKFESEADFLGVQYMYRAGYDPQALPAFFERVRAMQKRSEGTIARAFSTHPQTADRIERTQAEINTLLPARGEYTVDTSEFQEVKARVIELQGRTRMKHQTGPFLRRVSHREQDSPEAE